MKPCEVCGCACDSMLEFDWLLDGGEQWSMCSGCDPGLDEDEPGRTVTVKHGPRKGEEVDCAVKISSDALQFYPVRTYRVDDSETEDLTAAAEKLRAAGYTVTPPAGDVAGKGKG